MTQISMAGCGVKTDASGERDLVISTGGKQDSNTENDGLLTVTHKLLEWGVIRRI